MKIFTLIVLLYAVFSMLFQDRAPMACIEATSLLIFRPWGWLWDSGNGTDSPTAGLWPSGTGMPEADCPVWWQRWKKVLTPSVPDTDRVRIGVPRLRPGKRESRSIYFVGADYPIRPGDPVLVGDSLIGFVYRAQLPTVEVVFLNDPESRQVAAEVLGTVAGDKISFAAGGPSKEIEGGINVRFPTSRFGLRPGSLVYTGAEPFPSTIPPGLLLGQIRFGPQRRGGTAQEIAIVPPFSPCSLERVALSLPRARFDATAPPETVAVLPLDRIRVEARILPANRASGGDAVILAGRERGISKGDILAVNGFAVASVSRTGYFASSASLLASPGEHLSLTILPPHGEAVDFEGDVSAREGLDFLLTTDEPVAQWIPGSLVYLNKRPCSGLDVLPAYLAAGYDEDGALILKVPWKSGLDEAYCLQFRGPD